MGKDRGRWSVVRDPQITPVGFSEPTGQAQITQMVHAGVGAKAGGYSFNGNKIMTTSGGGMLASDDGDLDRVIEILLNCKR